MEKAFVEKAFVEKAVGIKHLGCFFLYILKSQNEILFHLYNPFDSST